MKRLFDIVASAIGLLLLSPLFLILAVWIKCDSNGPVFYKQKRVGQGNKDFDLYKFRSMRVGADKLGLITVGGRDPRITRSGYFIRKYKLDEFPQLINVLKGDMSIVGPRPERKFFIDKIMAINPDYELLYQLRPGLFSPATLYNGYTDTMEKMLERLRMDLEYLHTRSLWLDTKIIYLTVYSIISGKKF